MNYTHTVTADHKVETFGDAGQQISGTSWPDHDSALEYAKRMQQLFGGTVRIDDMRDEQTSGAA